MAATNIRANSFEVVCESNSANVSVIYNFGFKHLRAAILMRHKVIELENKYAHKELSSFFDEITSYSSVCIICSAASIEAIINELFLEPEPRGKLRPLIDNFEKEWKKIESFPPLKKYKKALTLLNAPSIDSNSIIYKDANSLIELRNYFMHYKSTWNEDNRRKEKLNRDLAGKFTLSPFILDNGDFLSEKCMSKGCVSWVINTVFNFLDEFNKQSSIHPDKFKFLNKLKDS